MMFFLNFVPLHNFGKGEARHFKFGTYHVLHNSMPNETVSNYTLRCRPHNRELVNKTSRLVESSFIVRMFYKDIY